MGGKHHKIDTTLAVEKYLCGSTLTDIAKEYGVSSSTVYYRLKKHGVEFRHHASDEIWTLQRREKAKHTAEAANAKKRGGVPMPVCVLCRNRMRPSTDGYGFKGAGHFCTMKCAAEWAERNVKETDVGAPSVSSKD